ncbi:MAG: DUF3302 domain-containing protein [Pirellulaceae bacterium]
MHDLLTYFAWAVMTILFLAIVVAIVLLGSLPGKIARKRNHPQADAINAASWIGLALAGVGWPFAFVWSFLRSGPAGYGEEFDGASPAGAPAQVVDDQIASLQKRIDAVEAELKARGSNNS